MPALSELIKTFTEETFEAEVLGSELPVVVDFFAPWCGPCRMLAPVLEKFAAQYAGKIIIGKVNLGSRDKPECQSLFRKYNTDEHGAIPFLIFVHNGEVIGTQTGFDYDQLLETITTFITETCGAMLNETALDERESVFTGALETAESDYYEQIGPVFKAYAALQQKIAATITEAGEDLASGKITEAEHDQRVTGAGNPEMEEARKALAKLREIEAAFVTALEKATNIFLEKAEPSA